MRSCQYSLVFPLTAQGKRTEHAECFMGQSWQCRRLRKALGGGEGFLEHKAPGLGAEDQEGKFY